MTGLLGLTSIDVRDNYHQQVPGFQLRVLREYGWKKEQIPAKWLTLYEQTKAEKAEWYAEARKKARENAKREEAKFHEANPLFDVVHNAICEFRKRNGHAVLDVSIRNPFRTVRESAGEPVEEVVGIGVKEWMEEWKRAPSTVVEKSVVKVKKESVGKVGRTKVWPDGRWKVYVKFADKSKRIM